MGANEKHAATYHGREYVPHLEDLRNDYVFDRGHDGETEDEARAEFDRLIATIRAEAKQEALEDLASKTHSKFQAAWIRGQAREYTQGPRKIVGAFATPETKENKK